jgi:hypothetical protein
MCEFSGRLVAWLDQELPDKESINVGWHVAHCAECRSAAQSFQEVSRAFLACYEAAREVPLSRDVRNSRVRASAVMGIGAAAAAAIVTALVLWPRPVERLPLHALPAAHAPAVAFVRPSVPEVAVRTEGVPAAKPIRSTWAPVQPAIEVELPADMLFPPGAVPEGFRFIAEVRTQP